MDDKLKIELREDGSVGFQFETEPVDFMTKENKDDKEGRKIGYSYSVNYSVLDNKEEASTHLSKALDEIQDNLEAIDKELSTLGEFDEEVFGHLVDLLETINLSEYLPKEDDKVEDGQKVLTPEQVEDKKEDKKTLLQLGTLVDQKNKIKQLNDNRKLYEEQRDKIKEQVERLNSL